MTGRMQRSKTSHGTSWAARGDLLGSPTDDCLLMDVFLIFPIGGKAFKEDRRLKGPLILVVGKRDQGSNWFQNVEIQTRDRQCQVPQTTQARCELNTEKVRQYWSIFFSGKCLQNLQVKQNSGGYPFLIRVLISRSILRTCQTDNLYPLQTIEQSSINLAYTNAYLAAVADTFIY